MRAFNATQTTAKRGDPVALTRRAHQLIKEHFEDPSRPKGLAIDGTCGNGFDTEFLCRQGFDKVIGFDIQTQALEATKTRLQQAGFEQAELHQKSHEQIGNLIGEPIDCAMFNFGYLPHGDKSITTLANSSLAAIEHTLERLRPSGVISLLCYPGHPSGAIETQTIESFLTTLTDPWTVIQEKAFSEHHRAPRLYMIRA